MVMIYLVVKLTAIYQKYKRNLFAGNLFLIFTLILISADLLANFGNTKYLPHSLFIIFLLIIAVVICLDMYRFQLDAQRETLRASFLEDQLSDQLHHYEALYQQMNKVHEIRHDVKNILINIDSYLTMGEVDAAHEYISRYQAEVSTEDVVNSGMPLIDAVLTAKKSGFDGDFQLYLETLKCEYIEIADICMMLAIALDNAAEGTANVEHPYIRLSMIQQSRMISIQIENPTMNRPIILHEFPKSTKPNAAEHGYGMKSCGRLARKWNGDMSWKCEDGVFTLDILIQDIPASQT